MSKNCASLSVYRCFFIITWTKNVAVLAPCLPSTHGFILPSPSGKEPPVSFGGPLLLFSSSVLYSWVLIPATSQKWLCFVEAPSLPSFIVFQQNQGQLTLFSGTLPAPNLCLCQWCVPRTWTCFSFSFWPFIDDLQGSVLTVLSLCLDFATWGDEYLKANVFSVKFPFHPSVVSPLLFSLSQD